MSQRNVMPDLMLALDQGSHASRALLYDGDGEIIDSAIVDVELERPDSVRAEHDAARLLYSLRSAIDQVLAGATARGCVCRCGIAVQRSTVVAWDPTGVALGKVLGWQDTRGAGLLPALAEHEAEIRELTGLPLSPYYGASKLHWLLQRMYAGGPGHSVGDPCGDPGGDRGRLRLSPLSSFLLFHLLENRPYLLDHGNAQRTQLFDIHKLDWSPQLLQWFGVPLHSLPVICPMIADYGRLAHGAGPSIEFRVTAVCGDQNAALAGAGEPEEDTLLVNIGSGAFLLRRLASCVTSESLLTGIATSDAHRVTWLREATVNGAGSALDWAGQAWQIPRLQQQLPDWLANERDPPVFINTVGGLGTPWMRGGIEPVLVGAAATTSNAQRAVAVIESIVFLIQVNLELMLAESPVRRLRVSGGLSRLDGLCRRLASLSGLPVERVDETESTARGVVWLAAGRPEHWNRERTMDMFTPVTDHGLRSRYSTFRVELENRLRPRMAPG